MEFKPLTFVRSDRHNCQLNCDSNFNTSSVGGLTYRSSTIGMGVSNWSLWPFGTMQWEIDAESKAFVDIYYCKYFPTIAVLHRGFDILGVIALGAVSWGLILFSAWIDSYAPGARSS